MNRKKLQMGCAAALAVYLLSAVLFYWIAGEQLHFRVEETAAVTPAQPIGELVQGMEVRQPFTAQCDEVTGVMLRLSTYGRTNTCRLIVSLLDGEGSVLAQQILAGEDIEDGALQKVFFAQPVRVDRDKWYAVVLASPDGTPGNAVTAWQGNTISAARTEIPVEIPAGQELLIDGAPQWGMLHVTVQTRSHMQFGAFYWYWAAGGGALLACYCGYLLYAVGKGKDVLILRVISAFRRYGYLMRQLIARDFKTKYKRSVLGILWSFLNPLLTMAVQYVVFSTIFRSDIPNFPLYLLTGIVCFNFFSEASSMALQSIVGNASLITKVYVPKYIYPVSRVLSSTVNLLLSLIPLLAVMLLTDTPVRPAILLLPFGLVCLVVFSIGVGFILSTAMVFFRDTQFLWGVVSMLWMYLTPIIYPESIIPAQFMTLYKCNPLYHIIRFIRIVLMDGISPEPKAYGLCMIASVVPFLIGAVIFKKNQDKFVLNL